MAAPTDPVVTADPGSTEAGRTRKLLLDEMLAERARPPLPPAPVLTVDPAPVDAAPISGIRGARKRLVEVEALARRNLRAAEEARRVVQEERQLLEEEASARTDAERTAAALRRELERLRSTEEQRAAQAQFAATSQARSELATEIERVHDEHARVVDELDRLRGTLFDHDSLLDEYSRRLREEQENQAKALGEQMRAEEALRVVERNLEIATETSRRRAEDDQARFTKVEDAWRNACIERDRATTELRSITTGDGELARLRAEIKATHEDQARLLADLDVQAARGDTAEAELATARAAQIEAERVAAEAERIAAAADEARDLAGISLETTRSELAERTEALDAERSTNQARIADLVAQLSTTTRTAESATERSADLESRLDAAMAARDDAVSGAESLNEQLARARADAEVLRTQAASIGDELAATQVELEKSKAALEDSRTALGSAREEARRAGEARMTAEARQSVEARRSVEALEPSEPVDPGPGLEAFAELAAPAPASFDSALATAFGQEPDETPDETVVPAASAPAKAAKPPKRTTFRTVEADPKRLRRAGGPVVELEASLIRQLEPVAAAAEAPDSSEAEGSAASAPERSAETQAWRRTAMAELTALATDSDDLTPKRRR